jgi:diguanylate cyclase (GGDEF)-like protein/PAS domain S-box-containing protein
MLENSFPLSPKLPDISDAGEPDRILIADDAEENLLLLRRILTNGGFEVESCSKSSLILPLAKSSQPSLVLLDINMPGIGGFEVCKLLKEEPLTSKIPVIFISALESTSNRLRGFEAGAVDYIVKPFEIEETLARVRTQVAIHNLQKKLESANRKLDAHVKELTLSQEKINQRDRKLSGLINALPNLVFVYDEKGQYLEIFNNETQNILSNSEEMLGKNISDYVPPEIAELKLEAIQSVLKTHQTKVIEYPLTMPGGNLEWFENRIALLENTQPGKGKVICVVTQITERVNLYKQVESLAIHDPLTDCFNRRHFLNLAEIEVARSIRFEHPLSLMILDVDHFKSINDRNGHPVGDEILKKMVDLCRGLLRSTDVIGRYGGEEFCILFTETGMQGAFQAAERIRQKIEDSRFATKLGDISITVSIGLACMEVMKERVVSVSDLIEEADKALYIAKEEGRNRIHTNCQAFPVGFAYEPVHRNKLNE